MGTSVLSLDVYLGFNRPAISPCPKALCTNESILSKQDVRNEFKQQIMKIKQEAYRKIQELSGGIENIKRKYPFQYLLFSEFSYSFTIQRSLVTTLGQKHIPNLLKFLAEKRGYIAKTNHRIEITLPTKIVRRIDEIVNSLDSGRRKPNMKVELKELVDLMQDRGIESEMKTQILTADIFIEDPKDPKYSYYIEIKTPQPKKEDCARVKRRLLLFRIYKYRQLIENKVEPSQAFEEALYSALIGFYYNPFKETTEEIRRKRRYPHSFFNRICDLNEALIAEELWDCLGGPGTYDELVKIIDEVVKQFKTIE